MHTSINNASDTRSGFVLVTVLILLALLMLIAVAQLYRAMTNQQESAASTMSMRASYYAETAISYAEWAWANDADFDLYANVSNMPSDNNLLGDREEWLTNTLQPGPTTKTGVDGQIMYWDNTPMADRAICWPISNCNNGNKPTMYHISSNLSRYIKIEINQITGALVPSIPAVPHSNPPVVGTDVPTNGAIIWLTAGNESTDYTVTNIACTNTAVEQGCFKATAGGVDIPYSVVAYAIGYANGKGLHLLRAVIQ
ncbi:MAG: hypothetical protein R8J85_02875 [Mariprofundales bacterium]